MLSIAAPSAALKIVTTSVSVSAGQAINEGGVDPFEECRVGTQRGLRLRSSLLDIAKSHLPK